MEELWEFFAGEEARRYRRTFSRVGAAMLAMILLPVGAQLLLQGLALAWAPALLENTVFLYGVSALTTYGIGFPAAMLVLLTLRPEGRDPERRRLNAQTWLGLWLLAIGWLYIANMVTLSLMDVLTTLRGEAIPNPVEALGELPVAFNLIYSCLLAPVCEELCFRWMILRRLRPWGDGFAVCASALLFALVHGNLYQMLYAFAVGLVLGGILLHTGSLKGCILLHAGVNFVSAGLLPLASLLGESGNLLLALLVLVSMVWALSWTFFQRREQLVDFAADTGWGDGETWGHFGVNPGMTLFVLALLWIMGLTMG